MHMSVHVTTRSRLNFRCIEAMQWVGSQLKTENMCFIYVTDQCRRKDTDLYELAI